MTGNGAAQLTSARGQAMSVNESGIPYITDVCNFAVGCVKNCGYCWARRLAYRIGSRTGCALCKTFVPHVHLRRLSFPRGKPRVIGLGFMTELLQKKDARWGDPETGKDIKQTVLLHRLRMLIKDCPMHTFVIPTRNLTLIPEEFQGLRNLYILGTVTSNIEVYRKPVFALLRTEPGRLVLNLEPLKTQPGIWEAQRHWKHLFAERLPGGIILGGLSGKLATPLHVDWAREVRDFARHFHIPFYFKQWGQLQPIGPYYPDTDRVITTEAMPKGSGIRCYEACGEAPIIHETDWEREWYKPRPDQNPWWYRRTRSVEETPELDGKRYTTLPWEMPE